MRFNGVESGADNQERILETSLVQNGGLLKHGDRTLGQKELLPRGCEGWLITYHEVGGGKEKGRLRKYFHVLNKTHKIPEALPLSSEGCFSL